eukprot:gene3286-3604_t
MMEKQSFRGPITAIARVLVRDKPLLLWGAGGVLHGWSESDHSEVSLPVFDSHNIHGIKPTEPSETGLCQLIVFGDKSLAFLKASEDGSSLVIISQERCDDLVLDCRLLRREKAQDDDVLIVGYAHNMIDIRRPRWPEKSELLRRVLCPHPSVLFALNIFGCLDDDGCLVVASGTVFGHLYIWQCALDESTSQTPNSHLQGSIIGQAKRHEGVIFRIVWSTRGDKLITVSDDRTVRLWTYDRSNGNQAGSGLSQLFEGWDHISRLWDAVFVGDDEEEVATCSEDGTVRLWNQSGQCTTVLVGHIDSVWRLLAIDDYLVTVGNDSAVKFWYLDHHRVCCPRLEGSTVMDMSIPSWELSAEPQEVIVQEGDEEEEAPQRKIYKSSSHANRRLNGVNSVFFSSCGKVIVLVLIEGMIWVVKAAGSDYLWERVVHLEQTVVTADVHVLAGNTSKNAEETLTLQVVVSFLDCTAAFLSIQGERNAQYQIVRRIDWKPHDYKCVNVWIIPVSLSLELGVLVCSATMKGLCRVWGLNEESYNMGLLAEMSTMKQEIVSSVLFHTTVDRHFIVLGDSRGGVGIYAVKETSNSWGVSNIKYFHRAHGSDPVSVLASSCLSGFVSAGHDGVMNFFEYQSGFWFHCNTLNIHPISTPDFLTIAIVRQNDWNEEDRNSIIVGGYHGSSYIVRDVYRSYQLLRIEGGGWKRPHKCAVNFPDNCKLGRNTLPAVQFVCPVPVGKNQTHLQLFGSRHQSDAKALYPLQLNSSCFGRVSYSSAIVPAPREEDSILAVGGEDCTMKVFNLSNLRLLQETTLSKNASLKSLHSCGNNNTNKACSRGIVLGGGGKLLYYLWSYDFTYNDEGCDKTQAGRVPLRKVCEGSVWPNATQDHRILAVRCLYLGVTNESQSEAVHHYGLFLADSRGILTILKFQHSFECCELIPSTVSRLFEVEVSDCPLLSCSSLLLQPFRMEEEGIRTIVCCVGDTKGAVHTLALPLQSSSAGLKLAAPSHIMSQSPHSMGTNNTDLVLLDSVNLEQYGGVFELLVGSCGDDQALCFQRLYLIINYERNRVTPEVERWRAHCVKAGALEKRSGAAGAAFKGVVCFSKRCIDDARQLLVATIAYDQRLTVWNVEMLGSSLAKSTLSLEAIVTQTPWTLLSDAWDRPGKIKLLEEEGGGVEESVLELPPFRVAWYDGKIVNLAEISSLTVSTNDDTGKAHFVVVGQGFQVLCYHS